MKLFFQYLNIIYSLLPYGLGLHRFGSWMRAVSKNSQPQRHLQGQIRFHRLSESKGILHIRKSSGSHDSIYPPRSATATKSLCGKLWEAVWLGLMTKYCPETHFPFGDLSLLLLFPQLWSQEELSPSLLNSLKVNPLCCLPLAPHRP